MGHKAKAPSVDLPQNSGGSSSSNAAAASAFSQLTFAEVLEDLSSRFIVNLPAEELSSIERICFQVEQAHWFYEDFLRPLNPSLASFSLRRFSSYLLHTSSLTVPLIQKYISPSASGKKSQQDLEAAFDEFMKYKTRVPVCGVVMLNRGLDKCVLVKGWKSSAAWGFPKGKINQQEIERDCAVREVLEETGFDCGALLPPDSTDFMELTMREQKIRLYIVPGVDEETHFETLTRKEISRIAWFKLSDLPTWKKNRAPPQGMGGKFYLISPFIGKLKQWIQENRGTKGGQISYTLEDDAGVMTRSNSKEEDVANRSVDLKNLLGLGGVPGEGGKGTQMIEEQGDARSRQLLDLLRGDSLAILPQEQVAATSAGPLMDERERGTAALLAALNVGAGKQAQMSPSNGSDSQSTLLSMLNGFPAAAENRVADREVTPLPAPKPQNTSQAQSLLKLISPSHSTTTLSPADGLSDKEKERGRQRDALLSSLMASSSLQQQQQQQRQPLPPPPEQRDERVDHFRFHPPPVTAAISNSSDLLSLLQPAPQPKTPSPSPFSSFVQQATQEKPLSPPQPDPAPSAPGGGNHLLDLLNARSAPSQPAASASSPYSPPPPTTSMPPMLPMHFNPASPYPPHPPTNYPQKYAMPAAGSLGNMPPPAPHHYHSMAPPPPPHLMHLQHASQPYPYPYLDVNRMS